MSQSKISSKNWHKDAVIYQIYPRSFQDSNGDGIGDLAGIVKRLPYIRDLGVNTIWISPFFKSPMKDFGYDVSDYCDVDPIFGDLEDFDRVIEEAHKLGLKVIIDQVLSHTSDEHPWFIESKSSRDNAKSNWYVWSDPSDDGTPPSNWLSIFGGSAWKWNSKRRQYYLHNFLEEQPDLNFHEPEVQAALLDSMEFWLQKGVDGFRLDTSNFYFHDPLLRNNPANLESIKRPSDQRSHSVYDHQYHIYDKSRPENIAWLHKMRTLCDNYDAILLGEIGCDNQIDRMLEYTWGEDRLHTAYSFALMGDRYDADFIKSQLSPFVLNQDQSWPCWATSNHDVKRTASRWLPEGKSVAPSTYLQSYAVMLMTMLGTPCIYQGEELGLTEAELAFEDLVDPPGITFWPEYKGRDGCRTPMVWNKDENAGFSSCKPWLPVPSEHKSLDMSAQINDQESLLNFYRKLLKWRQKHSCISSGTFEFIHTVGENVLAFKRYDTEAEVQVFINFGKEPEVLAATTGTVVFGTKGDTLAPGEHKVIEI